VTVILQGSLQFFEATELLGFLAGAHSGTFDAESGGQRLRLVIREGHVDWAEGSHDATGVVSQLLGWNDGVFTFQDEVLLPAGVSPLAIELAALIADAKQRIADARRTAGIYPDDGIRLRIVSRPPGEITMTADEFQVLFQIGSGKSLAQLCGESGRLPADLYPIIKRLEVTGLLELLANPDVTALTGEVAPERIPAPARESRQPQPPAGQPVPGSRSSRNEPELMGTLTGDDGVMHALLEETSVIGRTAEASRVAIAKKLVAAEPQPYTIALHDGKVSEPHACVVRSAEGFVIEDLASRNGTYVNSERISAKRLLADGDEVRVGRIILTFNLAAEVKSVPTVKV
jgi:hypothetical protein